MLATHISQHLSSAEKIQSVLCTCQYASNAGDYARLVIKAVARATGSRHAVWFNYPGIPAEVVAHTEGSESLLSILTELADRVPIACDPCPGIGSLAAVPVLFRSSVTGVLAVAGRAEPYDRFDLDLLIEIGRCALLEYESLQRAGELDLPRAPQRLAHLVHELRQPLGNVETHAFYLGLILPDDPNVRDHLAEMQLQIEWASRVLDESALGYTPREVLPCPEEGTGAGEDNRVFTNSAISMVT